MALTPPSDRSPEARGPREAAGGRRLARQVALTRWGLAAERAVRAFWPLWTILALALAGLLTGWAERLSLEGAWTLAVLAVLGLVAALAWGLWRFRLPSRDEAVARLDATLPGRPLAALADAQAVGREDAASRAVGEAHRARMGARAAAARAPAPDLRLAARDPFGLRYAALILLAAALLFGQAWKVAGGGGPVAGGGEALAQGPAWEGWIAPPPHTGRPQLYLADLPPGPLEIPEGSRITLRLYGEPGALTVDETVSARTGGAEGAEVESAAAAEQAFDAVQPGRLAIAGPGGAAWDVTLLPDQPPSVELAGPLEAGGEGELSQPFSASDDHGVTAGRATIALDLAAVDRRFGLEPAPDAREPLVLDLPLPISGSRAAFEERLVGDLSEHPLANLPVTLTLTVTDAAGQEGSSAPEALVLPGRRFFQPVARAIAEQRRDLLWARANAPRVEDLLRAVAHRPEDLFPDETLFLRLSFVIRRLDAIEPAAMTEEEREEIAQALWDIAVELEEGTLRDARERLERAQERLSEAMRNGASPEEIAGLMEELREATDDYLSMLAENMQPGEEGTDEPQTSQGEGQEVTQDQIQALMDEIQELMEQGRMAEAQALMEQLNELMENLQVTEGEGGGPRGPGQQSMQDLQDSLRDQQELSDEAFRDLQEQFGQGQQGQPGQGQQPGQGGQEPGEEPGGGGQEPGGEGEGSLADRQDALRDEIERQRRELPGLTGEAAEAARGALDRAGRAMDGAEEALREGDLAGAIDRQAEAMDALREGMRSLGEALAENGRLPGDEQRREAGGGEEGGRPVPGGRRDPLGRQVGEGGEHGSDQTLGEGEDVDRRAKELLDEIRRRAAEQERPRVELDYLRRLLERF